MNISVNMQTGNYINYMIQRYIQSDYSPLIEIWKQSVIHTHDFLSKEDYELILSKLPEYFSSVDMYVYRKESRIAAFMGVSGNKMEMLFCHPDFYWNIPMTARSFFMCLILIISGRA